MNICFLLLILHKGVGVGVGGRDRGLGGRKEKGMGAKVLHTDIQTRHTYRHTYRHTDPPTKWVLEELSLLKIVI